MAKGTRKPFDGFGDGSALDVVRSNRRINVVNFQDPRKYHSPFLMGAISEHRETQSTYQDASRHQTPDQNPVSCFPLHSSKSCCLLVLRRLLLVEPLVEVLGLIGGLPGEVADVFEAGEPDLGATGRLDRFDHFD